MKKWSLAIGIVLASVLPAVAADPPLMCFGNEPSWGLALEQPGTAQLRLPDAPPAEYQGTDTRLEPLRERVWRGRLAGGAGSDLVAFLREAECSDGMSDVKHPVVARVSLPDGRFLAGCCRLAATGTPAPPAVGAAPSTAPTTIEGPLWRLTRLRGQDAQALAGLPTAVTVRFEAGQLQGFDGCNQLVGAYTIDRDLLDLHRADGERVLLARRVVK